MKLDTTAGFYQTRSGSEAGSGDELAHDSGALRRENEFALPPPPPGGASKGVGMSGDEGCVQRA
jgi:hypothetical protein